MKTIKKVAVTPVTPNTGDIIDSFNTTDDKHTNAPSINAVESKMGAVQTATITHIENDVTFTLKFKRNMNVVTVNVNMFIPADKRIVNSWLDLDDLMPDWAKTSENENTVLDSAYYVSGGSISQSEVTFTDTARISLIKSVTYNSYRMMYIYRQADNTTYPDGQTVNLSLKYIVLD